MAGDIKNVFVSHVHEDDAGLQDLKDLTAKHGMTLRDGSIDSSSPNNAKSPEYIKSEILAPQINWAGTFLVYISPKTKDSEWVNWEIEYAVKQGKHIVGVWAHGSEGCELPEALKDYADAVVVGWNGPRIIDAINGKTTDIEKPDGTVINPRPLHRYKC